MMSTILSGHESEQTPKDDERGAWHAVDGVAKSWTRLSN